MFSVMKTIINIDETFVNAKKCITKKQALVKVFGEKTPKTKQKEKGGNNFKIRF